MKIQAFLNALSIVLALASATLPWWKIEVKILILRVVYFTHFYIWGLDVLTRYESEIFIWLSPKGIGSLITRLDVPFPKRMEFAQWLYLAAFLAFIAAIILNAMAPFIRGERGKRASYASTIFYGAAILAFLGAVKWFCSRHFVPLEGKRYIPVHPHAAVSWGFGVGFLIALATLGSRLALHLVDPRVTRIERLVQHGP